MDRSTVENWEIDSPRVGPSSESPGIVNPEKAATSGIADPGVRGAVGNDHAVVLPRDVRSFSDSGEPASPAGS